MNTLMIGLLLFVPFVCGWVTDSNSRRCTTTTFRVRLYSSTEGNGENPCWQDLYDDDCTMENNAAASFIASKWIKSMPCAAGIEDCDMPEKLQTPSERPEGGVDDVDVMGFLGLKRAKSLDKGSDDSDAKNMKP